MLGIIISNNLLENGVCYYIGWVLYLKLLIHVIGDGGDRLYYFIEVFSFNYEHFCLS